MKEIEIYKGIGEFNLLGTKDCSIFEFRNRPKIMVWEMNWNSLANFFIGKQTKQRVLYLEAFYKLEEGLNKGKVNEENSIELIEPLLNQFTNATYKIEIEELSDAYHIIYPGEPTYQNKEKTKYIVSKGIWAGGHPFIYSFQKINDSNRVEYYKSEIQNGLRPQILILQADNSEVSFILDGHHKLNAYNETTINANVVRIKKTNNYQISEERIWDAFNKLSSIEDVYLEDSEKIEYEYEIKNKLEHHLKGIRTLTLH